MRFSLPIAAFLLPAVAAAQASPSGPTGGDVRDVALMLDEGPLHLRFRVTLGGRPISELRRAYVDRLIASLDKDGDGEVNRVEARSTPLLAARRREKAEAFLATLDENKAVPWEEIETSVTRVGGEPVVYRQDETAAENDLEVFKVIDADGSGVVEPAEMARAALRILERDSDRDECVMFDEFVATTPMPQMRPAVLVEPADEPRPTVADRMRDATEPLLARRLTYRYDADRDGQVSAAELNWPEGRLKPLDRDGDGRLSLQEVAAFGTTAVDLELAIELDPAEGQKAIKVISGERLDDGGRPDFARFKVGATTLSVSHRDLDPIVSAVENSLAEFNRMDVDANGYLDPSETSLRTRFERGLFDAVDSDADGKIFAEEMEDYVRLRAEPSATSCRVNLYDTGRGFFQVLDGNGDGRISVREMRGAEASLAKARKKPDGPLTINDPSRSFHIEFVRGAFQLFGRPERTVAQSPTFVRRPAAGPIWFRRMDRNNDGDLTWNEFLGPRPVFTELDADGDGLIDPKEAESAGV